MSVDAFPLMAADDITMSVLCRNSLTDQQAKLAQVALRCLDPEWSLDCYESCESDLFLDLSSVRPDGRCVSFIIHARDDAIQVFRMVNDDDTRVGTFDDMAPAVGAVIQAITTAPA
ncbi:MAG TPA: hypothetical protein VFE41_35115 [Acetobacteraceae bacterium]|jgi:hypothetical protein|nr:hypothetical protein [Acetobacteraceae bacterium]